MPGRSSEQPGIFYYFFTGYNSISASRFVKAISPSSLSSISTTKLTIEFRLKLVRKSSNQDVLYFLF
ncbi:hypothetical protein FHK02_2797 [Spirosoma sp. LMG 31448]|uniref:Uncharacterized protein n=1 Tax=Spirosoma utsteinense TaxID=2585773 RepID=A0ABR6W5S0_9BACT|nr:hypothetical protein [Spirosoma utsteinense]MBC3791933.1 hypothetical protein [Spirosoma utsteinense]